MVKNRINNIIVIIGKISSGKSTLASQISEKFGIQIISFGKYLVNYSQENNLPTNRLDLQNLGERLIAEAPDLFLKNVLNFYLPIPGTIIIEGVRHKAIFELLKSESRLSTFIYVDTDNELRYTRFCNRRKSGDKELTFDQFIEMDSHSVESQIDTLSIMCDYNYSNEIQNDELYAFLSKKYNI